MFVDKWQIINFGLFFIIFDKPNKLMMNFKSSSMAFDQPFNCNLPVLMVNIAVYQEKYSSPLSHVYRTLTYGLLAQLHVFIYCENFEMKLSS